jgi:hypothetical protein
VDTEPLETRNPKPETSVALIELDLTALPLSARRTFDEVIRSETMAQIVRAKAEQLDLAAWNRRHPPRAIEGLGGQTFAATPFIWSALRRVCKAAPGEDVEIQKWAARKYPELRVRHQPSKMQVGYWSTPEFKPKFQKKYATTEEHG